MISQEELYEAIKQKIASHPAWEDYYIVWKNKERYIEDLKEQAKFIR